MKSFSPSPQHSDEALERNNDNGRYTGMVENSNMDTLTFQKTTMDENGQ